jgi:23S rRNA pseudouridine1911/1915/1917 synthase
VGRIRGSVTRTRPAEVPEGSVLSVFRVPIEQEGQRLDVFLRDQLRRTSRTRTQFIIRASAFDGAGRRLRPNCRVRAEQEIMLWRAPWDETPVPTEVAILHEDEHLLAVDKPANLPVHPTARYHKNTLIKILQAARPGQFVSLGHRLDRETSGILLVAKTPECDRALKHALERREGIDKTYVALTWGVPEDANGRREFRFEGNMELDPTNAYRVKMRMTTAPALSSSTRFAVEGIRTSARRRAYARVRCDLETGRQHQIRLHLATLGTPIVGDKLYGPDETCFARGVDGELTPEDVAMLELPRHALHAARLALPHPVTRAKVVIESPLPADLAGFWDSLRAPATPERRESPPRQSPRGILSRSI